MNNGKIYISEFNSEEKLRTEDAFTLPEISLFSKTSKALVRGMDALVITMLDPGDILVTAELLPQEYLDYWCENITEVKCLSPSGDMDSIYSRLIHDSSMTDILKDREIINYALVPDYYEMCSILGIDSTEPPLSVIKELNSKVYSNKLKYELDLPAKGIRLKSIDEYEEKVGKMLEDEGRILIKDAMGVSGKGMLLIDSQGMADRLAVHFTKQAEKGRTKFDFILEPYLNRVMDFSCIFTIDTEGKINIDGFQKNESKGFAYHGTGPLTANEYEMIMASGYRDTVIKIAEAMADKGYHGYACIDSMIAEGDIVIPLLEINPRMSLSRFNLKVSERIGRACRLGYIEGKLGDGVSVEQVLNELEDKGLLYTSCRGSGVIPLAPGIWNDSDLIGKRIRIYYIIVYNTEDEYEEILAAWFAYCSGSICAGNIN